MVEVSRRAVLVGGAFALGAAAVGAAAALPKGSSGSAEAAAAILAPSPTTTPLPALGIADPVLMASIVPSTSGAVMQQVELASTGELFMTQSLAGSAPGLYTTVVTRTTGITIDGGQAAEADAMTVLDGGHGMGLHVDPRSDGGHDVWVSLQGAVPQGDPAGGRLARFAYTPGVFTIDAIPGGVTWMPQFPNDRGEPQEAIYSFDAAQGVVVERMYDFRTNRAERFTRRSVSDVEQGVDRPLGRMTVPVNAPTMQGFATVDDRLFRWVGLGNSASGASVLSDPMAMEQFDWRTGRRIAITPFPTLGQEGGAWRDAAYEPEGCSIHRDADGNPSLLVGVTVGVTGDHAWPVYRLGLRSA